MALPFISQTAKSSSAVAWLASDLEARSLDPREFLKGDTSQPLQLDPLDESPPLPEHEINKRSFYPAMLEQDPESFKDNYILGEADIKITGENPLHQKHMADWEEEQSFNIEEDVNSILLDPTIDTKTKLQVLQQAQQGNLLSNDLEDKYRLSVANQEHDTLTDEESHELFAGVTVDTVKKHREVEEARQDALSVISGSGKTDFFLGVLRDFVPGVWAFDNWYFRQKVAEVLGESWKDHTAKSIALIGSTNKELGQMLDSILTPEKKIEFIKALAEAESPIPGTSYNKWSQMVDKTGQGQMGPIETSIENVFGWLDVIGAGKIIANPIKAWKHISKFEKMSDAERAFFAKHFLPAKLDKIGKDIPAAELAAAERARQAAVKQQDEIASNPPTGTGLVVREKPLGGELLGKEAPKEQRRLDSEEGRTVREAKGVNEPPEKASTKAPDIEDAEIVPPSQMIGIGAQPSISPTSPLGVTQSVNPTKTREMAMQGLRDPEFARQTGNQPGEIVGSFALEKMDDDFIKNNPDLAKELDDWDRAFNKRYDDTKLDPYLTDTVGRTVDKERIYRTFQETQGAYYQAANSSVSESLGKVEGRARYGRNQDFGATTFEEATQLEKNIQDSFPGNKTAIVQENGQFYVDMYWKKEYDPFSARMFGLESASAKFMGVPLGGLARSNVIKHIIPATNRLAEWLTKGGYLSSAQAVKTTELFGKLQKRIQDTKLKDELQDVLIHVSETQTYMKEGDLAAKFPHLDKAGRTELLEKQALWKRLSDYMHNVSNRLELERLQSDGVQGIWKDNNHLGNGKITDQVPVSVTEVYSFDLESGIKRPSDMTGKQFVKLDSPVTIGNREYEYALIGGGTTKLDMLPSTVVPKIEGYVARQNVEPWYVKAHPKSKFVNGESVTDQNTLRDKHTRTIGAGKTKKEADELVKKLQKEMGDDFVVDSIRERSDVGDAIITDFKVYKEKTDYGKTRGDRLPTIDGFARLEDPFVAMSKRIQTLSRLDAWRQYDEVVKKNFMERFSAFLPKGEFPNIIHDLKLPQNATEDMVKSFNVAQRVFEQYSNSKYKINMSDTFWKMMGHKIADLLEGSMGNIPSEWFREVANKGDQFRKGVGSLSTNLFINLAPAAQWIVQTQVALPFAMMEKGFRKDMHMLPGLYLNMLARAKEAVPYSKIINKVADDVSGTKKSEFDAIADAIYDSGLPQSVDLNMMLSGALDDISKPLNASVGVKALEAPGQVVKAATGVGKAIGYTPAQMIADMSGFLFAKARWERLNPGKNWNTPTNIRQIAADGWDIMGSMSSRAGAMPYQDGYFGEVFRFQAILHKNMFTLFSSKTLKKAPGEIVDPKVKLAAANMAIFGVYGVPAGTALMSAWDMFFGDEADPETLATYEKYKGGLVDLAVNGTIDMMFSEEDPPMDLAIGKRIGPMPDSIPYVDLGWTMYQFMTGNKTDNPRFPFVNATGAVFDAVRDTHDILTDRQEYNTVEALQTFGMELAEATSGGNNFMKAMALAEFDDKKNKFGTHHGLELTRAHMVAQIFGIQSAREVSTYEMLNNQKEREKAIEDRANDILARVEKLKDKIGTPEWNEAIRRIKVLNNGTPEKIQEEVASRVMQKSRAQYLTTREGMMKYLMLHYKGQNDKELKAMVANFKNGTPKEQEFIKFLERQLSGNTRED